MIDGVGIVLGRCVVKASGKNAVGYILICMEFV